MTLTYKNKIVPLQEGQSVLDALLDGGNAIPYACKKGVCQSCVLKGVAGNVPKAAQVGLKATQQEQGYFLSCLCKPQSDFEVSDCEDLGLKTPASILSVVEKTPSISVVRLKVEGNFSYRAGQYINLIRPWDQLTRSYSLASVEAIDQSELELHVMAFEGGNMSTWLCSQKAVGQAVDIMGPMGDCFYTPSFNDNNMLLLGYGTGLAPLYGILKEALFQGHKGEIHLYHWGNSPEALYYESETNTLIQDHKNIFYKTGLNVQTGESLSLDVDHHLSGESCSVIQKAIPSLKDWKIFLCGGEKNVNKARRVFYLSGANLQDIYADAFFTWQTTEGQEAEKAS